MSKECRYCFERCLNEYGCSNDKTGEHNCLWTNPKDRSWKCGHYQPVIDDNNDMMKDRVKANLVDEQGNDLDIKSEKFDEDIVGINIDRQDRIEHELYHKSEDRKTSDLFTSILDYDKIPYTDRLELISKICKLLQKMK